MAVVKLEIVTDTKDGSVKIRQLGDDLEKAGKKGTLFGDVMKGLNGKFSALTAGIGVGIGVGIFDKAIGGAQAFASALAGVVSTAVQTGGHLSDLSARTSLGVESLQKLGYAAGLAGVSLDSVSGAVTKMQNNLATAPQKFAALGLSVQQLSAMKPEEQLGAIAQKIAAIQDPAQRAAAAISIFGKSGAELLPMLISDLAAASDRAQELGLVMSDDVVKGLDATGDAADTLSQTWSGLWTNVGAALASSPAVAGALNEMATVIGQVSVGVQEATPLIAAFIGEFGSAAAETLRGVADGVRGVAEELESLGVKRNDVKEFLLGFAHGFAMVAAEAAKAAAAVATLGALPAFSSLGDVFGTPGNPKVSGKAGTPFGPMGAPPGMGLPAGAGDPVKLQQDIDAAAAKAKAEAEKAAAEMLRLLGQSNAQAQAEMAKLAAAVAKVGGVGALSATQLSHVGKEIATLAASGAEAVGPLTQVAAQLAAINAEQLAHGMSFGPTKEELRGFAPGVSLIPNQSRNLGDLTPFMGHNPIGPGNAIKEFDGIAAKTKEIQKVTVDWHAALEDVKNAFELIGIGADSVLGKVVGLGASMAALGKNAHDSFKNMTNAFGTHKNDKGDDVANAGLLGKLGAGLGFASTALSLGATLFSGLKGLFHKPEWKGIGQDAGRILGMSVGEELAKQIQSTMKTLHVDVKTASLLNLDSAMGESGLSASTFAPQVLQLIDGIAKGSIPAKQGLEALGKAFTLVKDEAMKAGAYGNAALSSILNAARKAGTLTEEMSGFISEQNSKIADGLNQVIGGLKPEFLGAAQGRLFAEAFGAAMADGLPAAYEKFKDSYAKLQEAGVALPADITSLFDLMGRADGLFKGAAESGQGLKSMLDGISAQGLLTAQTFADLGATAKAGYDQAIAGGAGAKEALASQMPYLQEAVKASQAQGVALDANTQELVKQAKDEGFVFPIDPMLKVVDLLGAIATKLGAEIPASCLPAQEGLTGLGDAAQAGADATVGAVEQAAAAVTGTLPGAAQDAAAQLSAMLAAGGETGATSITDSVSVAATTLQELLGQIAVPTVTVPYEFVATNGLPDGGSSSYGGGGGEGYNPKGYASGGYFTPRPGGHVIRVAEGGRPEWVLNDRQMARLQGGGGVQVNVHASPGMDERKLAQFVGQEVTRAVRRGGTTRREMRAVAGT